MRVLGFLLLAAVATAAPEYRPDRILVKPKPGIARSQLAAAHAAVQAQVHREYPRFGGWTVVKLPPGLSVKKAIEHYRRRGLFEHVQPDYIVHITAAPNDPAFLDGTLWGLHNTGQNAGTADADIDAPEAWNIRTNAGEIIVAVIDTGVRYTHEDLAGNMWVNTGEIPGNGIDDDANGYVDDVHGINAITGSGDPMDDHSHGTHCAGTIGATGDNATGIVGVAWRVKLMALKFLGANGGGSNSDAIECIHYAIEHGAHILSNSWGCQGCFDQALLDAIAAARDAGILFVAAAGNNAADMDATPFYPAGYPVENLVSVAATDRNDQRSSFSNYGANGVDLGAPGSDIYSTVHDSNNAYGFKSGTSMACPHVAGAFALVKAQFPSDAFPDLIWRVLGNVDPLASLSNRCVSGGRLNLHNALTQSPKPIANFTASPSSGEAPLIVAFTETSIGAVTSRSWDFGDGSPASSASNPTHTYTTNGTFSVTLTVSGPTGTGSATRTITVAEDYTMLPATFSWIDPAGMTELTLTDDSVSAAQALPFVFHFYGQPFTQIYVGSNGLLGFDNAGLFTFLNANMPNTGHPNNIICPYWDDLNPGTNGTVSIGTIGSAPNRVVVVSWVDVPHWPQVAPTFTFQALLYEGSNDIVFQYQEIQPSDTSYGAGRSATIGIENASGTIARKYSYNGAVPVSNGQAIRFTMSTPPFVMDGQVDSTNYLQSVSGMTLYAAVHGQTLYVATWSPGTNGPNDHFIFVSDQLLPTASANAPWAKAGQTAVAGTKPFLAGESQNDFVAWFDKEVPTASPAAKASTNAGQMEGTLDLVEAFGAVPDVLYLAAVAYGTADGGGRASQTPAGNGNSDIESSEFLAVPVVALLDNNADGLYDRLDPEMDFVVTGIQPDIVWACVPGRRYQLQYRDSWQTGDWTNLGPERTAAPGQIQMSHSDPTGVAARSYRVKLLPE